MFVLVVKLLVKTLFHFFFFLYPTFVNYINILAFYPYVFIFIIDGTTTP